MKFLSLDSPLMQGMNKVADLLIINLLTIACSIPIITIGAAFTALHYQALKIVRDEECYVVKGYFKSFKENFVQSTIIWLIIAVIYAIFGLDVYILLHSEGNLNNIITIVLFAAFVFALFMMTFVFPIQAKFVNTVTRTMKNALIMSIAQFPKTILMIILNIAPWAIALYAPQAVPLVIMFGFSLPAFAGAYLYNKFFKKLEEKIMEESGVKPDGEAEGEDEDEKIFHDQLDEVLQDKNQQ